MELMHHPALRVNVAAVTDADARSIYAESGWEPGPHPDTDPDDPSEIPRVLAADPSSDPEPKPRNPRTSRKA